ncbi:MAG: disulfide bond formation protein B [Rhodanobacteraceae bacterium]
MSASPLAWPFRPQFFIGFVVCAALLGYALFEQYHAGIAPCPLCSLQRVAFVALGIVFLIGAAHGPRAAGGRRIYAILVLLVAAAGIAIAARHLWLQSLPPDKVPDCGPGLAYMLDAFPLSKTLMMVFTGSGECAVVNWQFLGLAMPAWALIWFAILGVWALWSGFRART